MAPHCFRVQPLHLRLRRNLRRGQTDMTYGQLQRHGATQLLPAQVQRSANAGQAFFDKFKPKPGNSN